MPSTALLSCAVFFCSYSTTDIFGTNVYMGQSIFLSRQSDADLTKKCIQLPGDNLLHLVPRYMFNMIWTLNSIYCVFLYTFYISVVLNIIISYSHRRQHSYPCVCVTYTGWYVNRMQKCCNAQTHFPTSIAASESQLVVLAFTVVCKKKIFKLENKYYSMHMRFNQSL